MEAEFWTSRWREGRIGFHEGAPNAFLTAHAARLGAQRRVLVPLCGKSQDLAYLAGLGHSVLGVELVEDAVRAFFAEHSLTPTVTREGALTAYAHGAITLLAGDFFATTPARLGPVDGLYDRAALIALPEPMRSRYVAHLRSLLPRGADGLVVALEYPDPTRQGPPFSIPEADLRRYFDGLAVTRLDERAATGPAGAAGAVERAFHVRF